VKAAAEVKILFLDVDGVLTDGRIWLMPDGEEVKSFDVKDGLGLKMLSEAGVKIALISGRRSKAVERRARELGIQMVHQGVSDKRTLIKRILNDLGLRREEAGSVGDDLPDLVMFEETGLRCAVSDAVSGIKAEADFITREKGGRGAVREICDWIISCRAEIAQGRENGGK
jgi:YrbI family 3-deoxy-D-manno-octulosonate 8-phosphate phosphatase